MKKLLQALVILMIFSLAACSRQWRTANVEIDSGTVLQSLNDTLSVAAQSGESSSTNFQQLQQLGGSLYYSEAVAGQLATFGPNVPSVFAIPQWSFLLGVNATVSEVSSARAYFMESLTQAGAGYSLMLDVTVAGTRMVKTFTATGVSTEGGELVLQMDGGFELRSFDLFDGESLAETIQLRFVLQGLEVGKITTLQSI